MNRLSEGYKLAVDQNWGSMAKIGILGQKSRFWAQKKRSVLNGHQVLATTGKSRSKKRSTLFQNKYQSLQNSGVFVCCHSGLFFLRPGRK